jgi:hypothetical protein
MKFDDLLIEEFASLDSSKFTVSFTPLKIFVCGGTYNSRSHIPESVRHRLINYFIDRNDLLFRACIQAEDFKDYFKEGAYDDLLEFEKDIANVATLIIVFLESPGSLVELGLFCMDTSLASRLLIIAPAEETEKEDSFIFHGPLKNLRRNDKTSVLIYPLADPKNVQYDHIAFIARDVERKLDRIVKNVTFREKNTAHVAFLIYDIIVLSHPILSGEIEIALMAFNVDIDRRTVDRLLYLLEKIELIKFAIFGTLKYYFDVAGGVRRVKFNSDREIKDTPRLKMTFRQNFIMANDEQSEQRKIALTHINKVRPIEV